MLKLKKLPMIVDSNVIIHLLRNDIPEQTSKAADFFKKVENGEEEAKISILVIDEIIWGLGQFYGVKKDHFVPLLIKLLSLRNVNIIELKKEKIIEILIKVMKSSIDFTDLYLLAISGKDKVFSFDKDLTP